MDPTYEMIIQDIKDVIERKGMKQAVVAKRAGFTSQEFCNILNERRKLLRVEHILPITRALGITPNELLRESGKEEE